MFGYFLVLGLPDFRTISNPLKLEPRNAVWALLVDSNLLDRWISGSARAIHFGNERLAMGGVSVNYN